MLTHIRISGRCRVFVSACDQLLQCSERFVLRVVLKDSRKKIESNELDSLAGALFENECDAIHMMPKKNSKKKLNIVQDDETKDEDMKRRRRRITSRIAMEKRSYHHHPPHVFMMAMAKNQWMFRVRFRRIERETILWSRFWRVLFRRSVCVLYACEHFFLHFQMMNNVRSFVFLSCGNHFACVSVLCDLSKQRKATEKTLSLLPRRLPRPFHALHISKRFHMQINHARSVHSAVVLSSQLHHCFIRLCTNCVCVPMSPSRCAYSLRKKIHRDVCSPEPFRRFVFFCFHFCLKRRARITHDSAAKNRMKKKKWFATHWQKFEWGTDFSIFFFFFRFIFIFMSRDAPILICIHITHPEHCILAEFTWMRARPRTSTDWCKHIIRANETCGRGEATGRRNRTRRMWNSCMRHSHHFFLCLKFHLFSFKTFALVWRSAGARFVDIVRMCVGHPVGWANR